MSEIYARFSFTIVAADGDCDTGLGGLDNNFNALRKRDNIWYMGSSVVAKVGLLHRGVELGNTWATRDWTFQEMLLSRRIFLFHRSILIWKCRHCMRQEDSKGEVLEETTDSREPVTHIEATR